MSALGRLPFDGYADPDPHGQLTIGDDAPVSAWCAGHCGAVVLPPETRCAPCRAEEAADRNLWGTPRGDVGDGYCPDCERNLPWHYDTCPQRVTS